MARFKHKKGISFAGIPRDVVVHRSFKNLGYTARSLLILLAEQYRGKNNGNLTITWSIMSDWFGSNVTMYKARDELYKSGFIVINAYGGRSGSGTKLPHLYALTWELIDKLEGENNKMRYQHYPPRRSPLNYWKQDHNPDVKTKEERDEQFKKDLKKINKTHTTY